MTSPSAYEPETREFYDPAADPLATTLDLLRGPRMVTIFDGVEYPSHQIAQPSKLMGLHHVTDTVPQPYWYPMPKIVGERDCTWPGAQYWTGSEWKPCGEGSTI